MAKVVITIEDRPGDRVNVVCEPSFDTMMKMVNCGFDLTAGQGYAVSALRRVVEAGKEKGPLKLLVPRVAHA